MKREIIFGRHPVEELLKGNLSVEKIFILQSLTGPFEILIRDLAKQKNIPLVRVTQESLNKYSSGRNHQGIVALASPIQFQLIEDIIPHLYENDKLPLILILDHISDVRNFGAIARTAEVMGVHAIIIPRKGTAAINEDAIKASAGALFQIPVCRVANLKDAVRYLKNTGISILSANVGASSNVTSINFVNPVALVIGSEGHGVTKELLSVSDEQFSIPQVGKIDSLNVSVSAGICLYECQRQRMLSK